MCLSLRRFWTALQLLWSTVYVACGAAQVLAGIFFMISLPDLHLYSVIVAGAWNVIIGITTGMVACIHNISSKRQEAFLYMAISVLCVNLVNIMVMEFIFYTVDMPKLVKSYNNHMLIDYACFVTRIATSVVLVVAFVDSQLSFCSMQSAKKNRQLQHPRGLRKIRGSHEQVADIEYIIPRPKNTKSQHTVYNAYAQSWVFDAQENASCSNNTSSQPYFKVLQQNGDTPQKKNGITHQKQKKNAPGGNNMTVLQNGIVKENGHVVDNPVVHIEEASDDSNSNSDRKLCYMKSFSRSQSPMVLSASSSQISLNLNQIQQSSHHNPPIYQCLEKLTEPAIYRSRLNTALSNREEEVTQEGHHQIPQTVIMRRVESTSPQVEKVQYASLMKELQKAIVSKKEPSSITSPQSNTSDSATDDKTQNSKSSSRSEGTKNSDVEFSKELEAALQLIQDLESPNTIETPSEAKSPLDGGQTRALAVWRNNGSGGSDESEKTLSAVGSLTEIASPITECQPELYSFKPQVSSGNAEKTHTLPGTSVTVRCPDSQSTSGYSSPTHGPTPNWSTTSSINGSNIETKPTSYSIHNTNKSTVISLYSSPNQTKGKSITLVKITSDETTKIPSINENTASVDIKTTTINEMNSDNSSGVNSDNSSGVNSENNSVNAGENNSVDGYDLSSVIRGYDSTSKKSGKRSSLEEKTWSIPLQTAGWKLNSLLRRKKQNTTLPKLAPELEGAIIKSESLAYLTDLELLARHQRNQEMQREIEKRVVQQLSVPRTTRTESNC